MSEREPSPLDMLEGQTARQTDFGAYVRFLAQEGIPALQSTEDPTEEPMKRARRMRLLVGFMTARVLGNREKAGLSNDANQLWKDPGITRWIQEFVVDDEVKTLLGQGIVQGFKVAGLIPKNW